MKLVGKVSVEPLDDERLTNIERNLVVRVSELSQARGLAGFATGGRGARRLFALAAVAMAVLVASVVGWHLRGDGAPIDARPEQLAMTAGALDLGDAQIVGRDFTVTRTPSRVEIVMQPGVLDLHVEHRPERLFVVKAGNVEIEDVGTRFTVDYDGDNVDVRVTEGEVKVKHGGKDIAITASNAWTLELGPITIAELEARAQHGTQLAAVEPGATDRADEPDASPYREIGASAGPGGASTGNATETDSADVRRGTSAAGGKSGATGGKSGASSEPKKPSKSNARRALEQAKLEPPDDVGTDEPVAAIAAYRERLKTIDHGEDKWRVLYSIAFMQHRANQDAAALHTISGALRRKAGPAYKAALWLEVRIRCMKAFDDACRIAAQKYQANFSDGHHAGIAQEILKEISRGP